MNNLIGGNKTIQLFRKSQSIINEIGENISSHDELIAEFEGFLDYVSGEVNSANFNAAINESTHIFISDFCKIDGEPEILNAVIDNKTYEVKYIDNPMGLDEQLEIYLKLLGGQ